MFFLSVSSLDPTLTSYPIVQFSDVNAFLTLAATRHTLAPEVIKANERLYRIVEAAKAGRVPVKLVCSMSNVSLPALFV